MSNIGWTVKRYFELKINAFVKFERTFSHNVGEKKVSSNLRIEDFNPLW